MKILMKNKIKIEKGNAGNIGLLSILYSMFKDWERPGYVDMKEVYCLNQIDGFPKDTYVENGEFLGIEDNKAWFVVSTSRKNEILYFSVEMKNGKLKIARVDKAPKYDYAKIQNDITAIENAGLESPGNNLDSWDSIEKALTHKYIRRWPKKNGKGWDYLYPKDFLKPLLALKTLFGFKEEKVTQVYEENSIQKDYGADKKTFAAHILEYFSNKLKWDKYFEKKENKEKNESPVKMSTAKIAGTDTLGKENGGQSELSFDNTPKIKHNKDEGLALNRSLMRKIYGIYNAEERNHGRDQSDTGQRTLSAGTPAIRAGGGQEASNQHVPETKTGNNGGESLQLPVQSGERNGRDVRHTVKETKNIREACLSLLKSKKDSEMTEADKELLRQYEGAGGLGEGDASVHGTLYEYYTPRSVTKKVWELVDKHLAGKKEVLEPSAGIGRFAEDRPNDNFTLNEYDSISARISGILHPNAKVTQGAFQAMFSPGKPYAGKKYDVVIGNPPYGGYEGIWKGKGEGKGHSKYEEYFIDRGLDTLREGGIMAFVVPSSFLRTGSSKIKEKIASKGKLLEAWRLPNGTFNTTGVGTDIIILRKEPGNAKDFTNNAYFQENPSMVVGTETTRIGRFGKEEQYVALNGDDTFDTAIERIQADAVEAVPLGELTKVEEAKKKVKVSEGEARRNRSEAMKGNDNAYKGGPTDIYGTPKTELIAEYEARLETISDDVEAAKAAQRKSGFKGPMSEAVIKEAEGLQREIQRLKQEVDNEYEKQAKPESQSRSQAMMGNQNAAGSHDVDTAAEFNAKYNKHIAPEALEIWKQTNWDGSINENSVNKAYLENSGNYVKTADGKWYDIVNYTSGNIYEKLDSLERNKEILSKAEYERQKKILQSVLPTPKTVMDFDVSPLSVVAETFMTSEIQQGHGRNNPQEPMNLSNAFLEWLYEAKKDDLALPADATIWDIRDYVQKKRVVSSKGYNDEQKEANKAEARRKVTARREAAERLFNQYIREQLPLEDQKRLADVYNRYYNAVTQVDYTKIPVFLDGIAKNFKGNPFKANETQIKGVSWLGNQGNGIVAFDVGVGKTITALMAAVNDMQMGRCEKPIICVPKSVYKQNWLVEVSELFPNVKVNALGNFSDIAKYKNPDGTLNIEKGSITICTYEALTKIGFTDETLNNELKESFMEALDEMTDEEKAAAMEGNKKAKRKSAKQEETIMTKVGKASKTGENWVNWEDTGFDHITVDECLPYNTPVLTDRGWINIGDIVENRMACKVLSCNYEEYTVEWKQITDWMPKPLNHKIMKVNLENGESLVCTHNHKIWTAEEGYVVSEKIAGKTVFRLRDDVSSAPRNNKVLQQEMCRQAQTDKSEKKELRGLWKRIFFQITRGIGKCKTPILFGSLCDGLSKCTAGNEGSGTFKGPCNGGCDKRKENALPFDKDEGKQSHEKPRYNKENERETHREEIQEQGRERTDNRTPTNTNGQTQPSCGISNKDNGNHCRKCSKLLQGRLSLPWWENRHRAGWKQPQNSKTEIDGLKTGQVFSRIRVDSVEILERGSYEQYGFRNSEDKTVYDITVADNHNFIAAGILVKNCHNFRNSFSKPRNMERGNADEFKDVPGGSTSMRGLKLFAITQMIQKHNNGRNVHLLTATPFQNSPVEIYNMLSYVAREQLKEAGIYNFHEFLTQFAELKSEISVDSKSNIVQKNVMKGFKNLQALQRLLNQYIMKVDGEDAGIIRPDKKDWFYDLNMTAEQKDITEKIRAYLEAGPDPEKDPGATLRCINALRQAALSPLLVDDFEFLDEKAASTAGIHESKIKIKNRDFVKDSPKMSFVCESTVNLYKQHPDKGQIIHLPQGIEQYEDVKKYLVKQGIPADAIAFLSPEYLSAGDKGIDEKSEITAAFNDPNNKVKIIIGSDTIKEGVNLNGNTIETYPCMLPWNPTDLEQLIGRSWRQGNHQGMVHITIPLMNDSIDSFMYQKHDEKGTRLETLWNSKASKIDIDGIDPEELKFSLIKDPKKRADLFIKEKSAELIQKQKIAAANSDKIFTMAGDWKNLDKDNSDYQEEIEKLKKAQETFNAKSDKTIMEEHDIDFNVSWRNSIYDDFAHVRGKNMKEIRENYGKEIKNQIAEAQKGIQRNKGKMATIDNTLRRYGIENSGNMATIERIRKRFSEEAMGYKAQIDAIEANRGKYIQEAAQKIKEESKPGMSVSEAVGTNVKTVTENLYSMDVVKERIANEGGGVKKSYTLVMQGNIYIKRGN